MKLMMYLGNDLIDSVIVNDMDLSVPGYLGRFKRQFKQKYSDLIQETGAQPEYLLVPVQPAQTANRNQKN
ncbi:MAG: hypothetical protein WKF70_15050 [Chitinophagaceae bacterium]